MTQRDAQRTPERVPAPAQATTALPPVRLSRMVTPSATSPTAPCPAFISDCAARIRSRHQKCSCSTRPRSATRSSGGREPLSAYLPSRRRAQPAVDAGRGGKCARGARLLRAEHSRRKRLSLASAVLTPALFAAAAGLLAISVRGGTVGDALRTAGGSNASPGSFSNSPPSWWRCMRSSPSVGRSCGGCTARGGCRRIRCATSWKTSTNRPPPR